MASTFQFIEDNSGSAIRTLARTGCYWKNYDSPWDVTDYGTYPVTAGNCSYRKYQAGYITGTYNQVSNGKFGHTANTLGTSIYLFTVISGGYQTPTTGYLSGMGGAVNITAPSGLAAAYQAVQFGASTSGSFSASTTGNPAYTQYFVTQVQTETGASPGDSSSITLTFSFDES